MNRVTLKLEISRLRNCSTRLIFQQIPDEIAGGCKISAQLEPTTRSRGACATSCIKLHSHRGDRGTSNQGTVRRFSLDSTRLDPTRLDSTRPMTRQLRPLSLDYASGNRALRWPTYRWQTRTIRVQEAAERICKSRSPQLHTDGGTFYKDFGRSLELGQRRPDETQLVLR